MSRWNWAGRAAAGLGLLSLLAAGAAGAATQSLVILHTNDVHGHLRAFCYIEVAKGPQEHCDVGGAAKRAPLIRSLTAKAGAPVMIIDAGDTSARGPLATEYNGVDEIEAMNAIGYDMAAVGNNEFKIRDGADAQDAAGSQAALLRLVRLSRFPWLCANATDASGALLPGVQPFVVRQVGGLKVAFLGLTAPRSKFYSQVKGWVITDPVEAAKIWIPRARAEADVVIAVTHLGVTDDQRLAHETRGIDAIVGGDSHTFLYKPLEEKNLDGQVVPIVQDGEFGVNLGEYRLTFEGDGAKGWRLTAFADRLVPVDASIRPDPAIAALVETYAHPLDVKAGTIAEVGATPADRSRLTALALAGAWKAAAGVDIGLEPEGAMFASFHAQSVSRFDVRAVLPFHETVWRGELTGAAIKSLLEKPSPLGGIMRATTPLADIDPAKTYSVAATAFVAQAGMPHAVDTGKETRQAVEDWLVAKRP